MTLMKKIITLKLFMYITVMNTLIYAQNRILVFQTDFGLKDGAVSAMKGVAIGVDSRLQLFDLTHEIPPYNIWEAAYRLEQVLPYWPAGTVFVSVVDPGVGTERKSVVLKTNTGHYIVTPDNGTLTLVAASMGVEAIREIDEAINRRKGSEKSYTFHGRDVYAFTAARLAAGIIAFVQVGKILPKEVVNIPYQKAQVTGSKVTGTIDILDIQYGNIWTNIPVETFNKLLVKTGDSLSVKIYKNNIQKYHGVMPFVETFGAVAENKPLAYFNSLMRLSFALNQRNFSETYKIGSGNEWTVDIERKDSR